MVKQGGDGFTLLWQIDGPGVLVVCDYCGAHMVEAPSMDQLVPAEVRRLKDLHAKYCPVWPFPPEELDALPF